MHNASKNTDLLPEGKWCPGCEKARKIDKFYALKDGHFYSYCIDCSRERNKTKYKASGRSEKRRVRQQELHRIRTFGVTEQQYDAMFEEQEGLCAACGCPETEIDARSKKVRLLAVDHCHKTGRVRALLCGPCNRALGYFNEDSRRIAGLLRYAERINMKEEYEHD